MKRAIVSIVIERSLLNTDVIFHTQLKHCVKFNTFRVFQTIYLIFCVNLTQEIV